jgi:[acyl-carrier-protein] S-malonyltransferase
MGRALHDADSGARALFAEADAVLGYPLSKLCFEGPEEELTSTANAQPAILTVSIAALHFLRARTAVAPMAVAGHSLGEYSALVAAGALRWPRSWGSRPTRWLQPVVRRPAPRW